MSTLKIQTKETQNPELIICGCKNLVSDKFYYKNRTHCGFYKNTTRSKNNKLNFLTLQTKQQQSRSPSQKVEKSKSFKQFWANLTKSTRKKRGLVIEQKNLQQKKQKQKYQHLSKKPTPRSKFISNKLNFIINLDLLKSKQNCLTVKDDSYNEDQFTLIQEQIAEFKYGLQQREKFRKKLKNKLKQNYENKIQKVQQQPIPIPQKDKPKASKVVLQYNEIDYNTNLKIKKKDLLDFDNGLFCHQKQKYYKSYNEKTRKQRQNKTLQSEPTSSRGDDFRYLRYVSDGRFKKQFKRKSKSKKSLDCLRLIKNKQDIIKISREGTQQQKLITQYLEQIIQKKSNNQQ